MKLKNMRILVLLFLLSLLLNVYGLWWGLPNYYTWSFDDLTPEQPLILAKNHLKLNSPYPPLHFVLSGLVYSPYLLYLYLNGGLVLEGPFENRLSYFTDPLSSLTVLLSLSRLISAVMGSLAVVFVYLGVKTLYGKKAALFSSLIVAFSYIIILFAHLGNLEIPYAFWFTVALYVYTKLLKTYETKYYILFRVFTALAISTKDLIIGPFVLLPIPLLYLHLKHHLKNSSLKSALFNKKLVYCLSALIITFLLTNNILVDFEGFKYRINVFTNKETNLYNSELFGFPNTFFGQIQLFEDYLSKLKTSVGIGLFLLLLIGLFYCIYKFDYRTFAFLTPLVSYYLFNIARLHWIYWRYTIPGIILLSYFAGKFLSDLVENINFRKIVYFIIILVFVHAFLYGVSADLSMVYDSRHSAEEWMMKNIDKNSKIEVYTDSKSLPRFHALGYENVSMVLLAWNSTTKPPVLLFEPVAASPDLELLKTRNPDYIIIPLCCDINLEYVLLQTEFGKTDKNFKRTTENEDEIRDYMRLLLSEKAGYKTIKVFENKIPFGPEFPFWYKRTNVPVIILERNT